MNTSAVGDAPRHVGRNTRGVERINEWMDSLTTDHANCRLEVTGESACLEVRGEIIDTSTVTTILEEPDTSNQLVASYEDDGDAVLVIELDPAYHREIRDVEACVW